MDRNEMREEIKRLNNALNEKKRNKKLNFS